MVYGSGEGVSCPSTVGIPVFFCDLFFTFFFFFFGRLIFDLELGSLLLLVKPHGQRGRCDIFREEA